MVNEYVLETSRGRQSQEAFAERRARPVIGYDSHTMAAQGEVQAHVNKKQNGPTQDAVETMERILHSTKPRLTVVFTQGTGSRLLARNPPNKTRHS